MKKLSHKEICRMGEMMDGIKLNCNVYTFENAENYISRLEPFDEKSGVCCHKVNEIIQEIKKEFPDAKGCQVDSKYYAAGVYGCIGRLSKVTVLDSEWNSNGKAFIFIFKPKRSNVERPPWNGLPVLMMADQKGRKNEILRTTEKRKSVVINGR